MSRRIGRTAMLLCLVWAAACAGRAPRLYPSPTSSPVSRLLEADALVQRGCYTCLQDALAIYESVAADPEVPSARVKAFDTALLLAVREREIGLGAGTSLARAVALGEVLPVPYDVRAMVQMAEVVPWKAGSISKEQADTMFGAYQTIADNAPAWRQWLRVDGAKDLVRVSLRLSLECAYRGGALLDRDASEPWKPSADAPLPLRFQAAVCHPGASDALDSILLDEPRFTEARLFLGERAFGGGRLIEAEQHMLQALASFPQMAGAATYLGSIYMAMEDIDESLGFYAKAVALVPGHREAMLGQMKCLSYLGRNADAIAVANRMLSLGTWFLGDAYYWRAWNRHRTKEFDGAWEDIQSAKRYLPMDGTVAKLTGLIAIGRNELPRAEDEFRVAVRYNDKDSDASFYLASALASLKKWKESAESFVAAVPLYKKDEESLRTKIREISASRLSDARKTRLIASKEGQIAATVLQQARSAYSAAAGWFNSGDPESARPLAERAAEHPEFADAAKKLLEKLPKTP